MVDNKLCNFCPEGIPIVMLTDAQLRACSKDFDKIIDRVPRWDNKTKIGEFRDQMRKKRQ